MRNDILNVVRIIFKQTATTGEKGTIPASDDHTDGTWLSTDLYIGEGLINTTDNILYIRTVGGITEIEMGAADSEIFTKTITVNTASVLSLNSTPVELIPADSGGRAIEVIAAVGNLKYNSAVYTRYYNLRILSGTNVVAQLNNRQLLASTATRTLAFSKIELASATTDNELTASAINLTCDGDPQDGNSDITIFLTYRYITLP